MTKSAAPKLNEEKSPGRLHTNSFNKIIRNCVELYGILTVQALSSHDGAEAEPERVLKSNCCITYNS